MILKDELDLTPKQVAESLKQEECVKLLNDAELHLAAMQKKPSPLLLSPPPPPPRENVALAEIQNGSL